MKSEVRSPRVSAPVGPYSQAIDAGAVYCAGQIGTDPSTGRLEEGIVAQTARALDNLDAVLSEAGLGLGSVVKTTVFLADLSDYAQMNAEYSKHFQAPFPARTTVQASALPGGARVEIDAIAVR
ncbi:MAG: reactive intermediate/imine deaminase [Thaumarchaeota archaeon]|nr:reactive intermediate/imine deaminase [Nitrososphaerota archaeon]